MSNLLHQKCQSLVGTAPMSDAVAHEHLAQISGWQLKDGSIEKTYSFKNYLETMAFVNALAWVCHTEDHHPELAVSYSRCVVRFNTHSVGGISINDFICAAKTDALVAFIA
jgi:4a-hydroxytetrahydrobiopterin dehydratase